MVEAIVSSTVGKLRDLMIEEASFPSRVKNQVQEIQTELVRMKCFLKDADRIPYEDESVHNWKKSVRELSYKIEDVIETYAIKIESRKGKGVKSTLRRHACILDERVNLHKLGIEIGNIKKEIASITSSLQTYGIKFENEGQSSNAATKNLLRQAFAHETDEHFVGKQSDINKLVTLIIDRDEGHRIISINGMGGLGKTSLAKQVFNHKDVQNHFESSAWVVVSQQFEVENVLKDILRQLDTRRDKNDIKGMEFREMVQELSKFQTEKKCLVVLGDIWKREHWDAFSPAFANTSVDCKVLLTTRIQEVAEIGILHKLKVLSEEEGWKLLKKKAFNSKNGKDSNLEAEQEKLGNEMVRKCGYLPLAISVIGGILSKKETLKDWEMVNEDMDSYLKSGEEVECNNEVMQILTLSYNDLPYQLKPCLLYLAYYSEDAEINLQNLYWMWIVEGLISSKDQRRNESLMEVAERYLNVLASRSLVQVQLNEESSGTSKSCRLHDLIHDLCVSKCEEEDFLKVIDIWESKQPKYDLNSLGGNAYRLVIYDYGSKDDGNVHEILKEANRGARVFSLMRYSNFACGLLEDLGKFQFLRIVTFESPDFSSTNVLHKVIKKLIHLRCLIFEYCKLKEVSSSIGELIYLQTFHLSCRSLSEVKIPNVFWKLKILLHFVVLGYLWCGSPIELRFDFCNGLETLIISDKYVPAIKDLSKFTNLRVFDLYVYDNKNLSLIINFVKRKWHSKRYIKVKIHRGCDFVGTVVSILLHRFFLCHAIQYLVIWEVPISELPKYELGMSSDLVDLELECNFIKEDLMPTLEKLPK